MSNRATLRASIESDSLTIAPGMYDGISALLVERMGFESGFISGAGVSNSRIARPDVGFLNLSENVDHCGRIADAVDIPVFADADTGYGNAVNVYYTVKEFEKAGVAGIMIEDQEWPKRCGHMEGKSVVSMADMRRKVEAADDARNETDPEFIVKARTDAAKTHGVDEAIRRLNTYADAGADLLFADALLSAEDIRRVCEEVDGPISVNMGYGIKDRPTTPLMSPQELEAAGVSYVLYPRLITGAAVQGMKNALEALQHSINEDDEGVTTRPELTVGFEEYTDMIGLPHIEDLEDRFSSE